jgi:hypothetical protein
VICGNSGGLMSTLSVRLLSSGIAVFDCQSKSELERDSYESDSL